MYWRTVTPLLRETSINMMSASVFDSFRLDGGTNLSLQWGHRMSVDSDRLLMRNMEQLI